MLRSIYVLVKNANNAIITINDELYVYGNSYEENFILNIKVIANGYSDYVKQITVPNSNLLLNIELIPSESSGDYVDLTSQQEISGLKIFEAQYQNRDIFRNIALKAYNYDSQNVQKYASGSRLAFYDVNNEEYAYIGHNVNFQARQFFYMLMKAGSTTNVFGIEIPQNKTDAILHASNSIKQSIANLSFPSTSKTDLTLGASGAEYTAEYNGYVFIGGITTARGGFVSIPWANVQVGNQHYDANMLINLVAPVAKGQTYYVYYSAFRCDYFRFNRAISD